MIITLLQGIIFLTYISFLLITFGKPLPSISDSWYQLPNNRNYLFNYFCISLGILMIFQTNGHSGYFFASGAGLCFVGSAVMFETTENFISTIHFTGAFVGIACALVGIVIERNSFIPLTLFIATTIGILITKPNNSTWWIEISAFICIILGLLIY